MSLRSPLLWFGMETTLNSFIFLPYSWGESLLLTCVWSRSTQLLCTGVSSIYILIGSRWSALIWCREFTHSMWLPCGVPHLLFHLHHIWFCCQEIQALIYNTVTVLNYLNKSVHLYIMLHHVHVMMVHRGKLDDDIICLILSTNVQQSFWNDKLSNRACESVRER